MARVFITGSSDGLGLIAARLLIEEGHSVIAHARGERRAGQTRKALPGAEQVVTGDLSSIEQTRGVAVQVNALGEVDAVIYNAGVGPDVLSNAVNPGWVPTKMGGAGAPDDLEQGALTQAWLAVSDEPAALVSGRYFFHQQPQQPHPRPVPMRSRTR
jgi:NAD(P)-dependent dehydrogenase (short-subunit alcohol dehydrogenase family)